MAYVKQTKLSGEVITSEWANLVQTQYDEVKSELAKTNGSDITVKLFDGTTKSTDGTMASNSDSNMATEKAVKTYVDTGLGTKLNSATYTASDILTKIKTVDGSGSGLDADTVDGAQLSTDGTFTSDSDTKVPSEKAVKTYVDGLAGWQYITGTTLVSNTLTVTLTSAKFNDYKAIKIIFSTSSASASADDLKVSTNNGLAITLVKALDYSGNMPALGEILLTPKIMTGATEKPVVAWFIDDYTRSAQFAFGADDIATADISSLYFTSVGGSVQIKAGSFFTVLGLI